jgi:hypothetical protein
MTKLQLLFLLLILPITSAYGQSERPDRTWIGGGLTVTGATTDGGKTINGTYFEAAYDLRHNLQARGLGEYRRDAAIRNLFSAGVAPVEAKSEIRYGAGVVYHFRDEGSIRPFFGGGVSAIRQFFCSTGQPVRNYRDYLLYNSSVNPTIVAGVGLGRNSEFVFTRFLKDTYSYSNLRGFGFDFSQARRLSGKLHLRTGVRARLWTFREGAEDYNERAGEVSGFVGFHFQ